MDFVCFIVVERPFPIAFFARVSPSAMAPPPNCFLCFSRAITRVIAQETINKMFFVFFYRI
jgi:hypothetical protein